MSAKTKQRSLKKRQFKSGQYYRTPFAGPIKPQVFKLVVPMGNLGDEHGGHWWVFNPTLNYKTAVLVDGCPRVTAAQLRRWKLK